MVNANGENDWLLKKTPVPLSQRSITHRKGGAILRRTIKHEMRHEERFLMKWISPPTSQSLPHGWSYRVDGTAAAFEGVCDEERVGVSVM